MEMQNHRPIEIHEVGSFFKITLWEHADLLTAFPYKLTSKLVARNGAVHEESWEFQTKTQAREMMLESVEETIDLGVESGMLSEQLKVGVQHMNVLPPVTKAA